MPRRWRRVEPESPRWWARYRRLLSEGFVHQEAATLAEGIIGSKAMLRGRRIRKKWYEEAKRAGLTAEEIAERVEEMYDTHDWMSEYTQFYPEEGDEGDEYERYRILTKEDLK